MRNRRARVQVLCLLLTGVLGSIPALANEANYQQFIVGERASGMGGAVCAIANSVDACFFNPAGLARVTDNTLSISASLYGFQQLELQDSLYPGEDAKTDTFVSIPSTFCSIWKLGTNEAFAFSAFIPHNNQIAQSQVYDFDQHFYNFSLNDQVVWLGPSYGVALSDKLYAGVSAFLVYRSYYRSENLYWGNYSWAYSSAFQYDALGALSVIGLQYRPDKRWNLGLTLQTPSLAITGSGDFHSYQVIGLDEFHNASSAYASSLDARYEVPAKVTLGLGWEEPKVKSWGADLTYHFANNYRRLEGHFVNGSEAYSRAKHEEVLDLNVGGEYYLQKKYPVRAGFFTSFSYAPDPDPLRTDYPAQIDLYGFTTSIGTETKNMSFNIGLNYVIGTGETLSWENPTGAFEIGSGDARETQMYAFFNTSYYF